MGSESRATRCRAWLHRHNTGYLPKPPWASVVIGPPSPGGYKHRKKNAGESLSTVADRHESHSAVSAVSHLGAGQSGTSLISGYSTPADTPPLTQASLLCKTVESLLDCSDI